MLKRIKKAFKTLVEPEEIEQSINAGFKAEGDGQAAFLPDMTEEEYDQYLEDEVNGWKKFKKKLGL